MLRQVDRDTGPGEHAAAKSWWGARPINNLSSNVNERRAVIPQWSRWTLFVCAGVCGVGADEERHARGIVEILGAASSATVGGEEFERQFARAKVGLGSLGALRRGHAGSYR